MEIKLLQAGFSDFLTIDDADEVGGTSNSYYFDKHSEVPLRPTTIRESSSEIPSLLATELIASNSDV